MKTKGEKSMAMDGKPMKMLPSISIKETDLPCIKDCKVDEVMWLMMKVKVTSVGREKWSEDKKMTAQMDIMDIKEAENKEEYKDEYARKMSKAAGRM